MVRVLEVITGGEPGGAQRHVRDLAWGLQQRGHSVLVAHGGGRWLDAHRFPVMYVEHLVRDVHPVRDFRAYRDITALIRRWRPDVVHTHSSKAGIIGRLAAHRAGVPAVFTAHGFVFLDPSVSSGWRRVFQTLEASLGRRSALVITVSQRDEKAAKDVGIASVCHIPNGVEIPRTMVREAAARPYVLGFFGRFSREKGFHTLVDALSSMTNPPQLLVGGDGPERSKYEAWVRESRLADVTFMGWQDPESFFSQVGALVIPSVKEGLPYTLLDALAAGLPVAVTDVGGMAEVVSQLSPSLVATPGDAASIRRAIIAAFSVPPDFGQRARTLIRHQYYLPAMVKETVSTLEAIADKYGHPSTTRTARR